MRAESITIKIPEINDALQINSLIIDVFKKCVAPDYSKEGVEFFLSICTPESVVEKFNENTPIFIANSGKMVVGVIWTRGNNHISRFFVDTAYQRIGIGRNLFNTLLNEVSRKYPDISEISVNSSPFAVYAYEKLGFVKIDEVKIGNGMKYIPMVYKIDF
jgi:GNAT superfamily N-acetyltransferase